MKATNKLSGITILEVLVSMVIIAILAAALAGISVSAKSGAIRVTAIERLRQVGIAAALYQSDNGDWPDSMDRLVESASIPSGVLKSGEDITDGWGRISELCVSGKTIATKTSIESTLSDPKKFPRILDVEEGKVALLVDRTMGRVIPRHQRRLLRGEPMERSDACTIFGFYQGRGVQLAYDLSAKVKDISETRSESDSTTVSIGLKQVFLLP